MNKTKRREEGEASMGQNYFTQSNGEPCQWMKLEERTSHGSVNQFSKAGQLVLYVFLTVGTYLKY